MPLLVGDAHIQILFDRRCYKAIRASDRQLPHGQPSSLNGFSSCVVLPNRLAVLTRVRDDGDSPSSVMNLCISSRFLIAIPSQGEWLEVTTGRLQQWRGLFCLAFRFQPLSE